MLFKRLLRIKRGPVALFLRILSGLYGLGVDFRYKAYERGIKEIRVCPGFVLSIGNMVLGGTGKTPLTLRVAKWAYHKGYRVAVISRGYKGRLSKKRPLLVRDQTNIYLGPKEAGDEPYMMAKELAKTPVLIGRDRLKAMELANRLFGSDLFLLDDAFQNLSIKKDLDILILRGDEAKHSLFPAGILREPLDAIYRAHMLLFTGEPEADLKGFLPKDVPTFHMNQVPKALLDPIKKKTLPLTTLNKKPVLAFCGIGNPLGFKHTLEDLGAELLGFYQFPDHYLYNKMSLERLKKKPLREEALFVTTYKDWVRLEHLYPFPNLNNILVLLTEISIKGEKEFFSRIEQAFNLYKKGHGAE